MTNDQETPSEKKERRSNSYYGAIACLVILAILALLVVTFVPKLHELKKLQPEYQQK